MALTVAQIIDLATQAAKCPGFTNQAQLFLNSALSELCQNYDFDTIRKTFNFNFSTSATGLGYAPGSGPNLMPLDFLRLRRGGHFYTISGVPYKLIGVEQEEFDAYVQQAGLNNFPLRAYVDVQTSPAGLYVWPPASGAYPVTIRYQPLMPDPALTDVPWFPVADYLVTRVAGELMKITNDDRAIGFIGNEDPDKDNPGSATDILRRYMRMKDNPEITVKTVQLDRRIFRAPWSSLPNTKQIGW